jgi:hypothetical protein
LAGIGERDRHRASSKPGGRRFLFFGKRKEGGGSPATASVGAASRLAPSPAPAIGDVSPVSQPGDPQGTAVAPVGEKGAAKLKEPFPSERPPGAPVDPWTAFVRAPERPPGLILRATRGFFRSLIHEYALAIYAGLLLAVGLTWPTLRYPLHTLPQDLGDPARQAWQISWIGHILLTHPQQLWQSNAFYPEPNSLAFGDSLLGYGPVGMLGDGPLAATLRYNILYVLAHALLAIGGYALVRQLGAGRTGAAVAAVAIAYAPWRLAQEGHLDIISAGGIPLALAMLARGHGWSLRRGLRPEERNAGWAAFGWLAAAWQVSLGFSLGLPFLGVLGLIVLLLLFGTPLIWLRRRSRRRAHQRRLAQSALASAGPAQLPSAQATTGPASLAAGQTTPAVQAAHAAPPGTQPAGRPSPSGQPLGTASTGENTTGSQPSRTASAGENTTGSQPGGTASAGDQAASASIVGGQPSDTALVGDQATGTVSSGSPSASGQSSDTAPLGGRPANVAPSDDQPLVDGQPPSSAPVGGQVSGSTTLGSQSPGPVPSVDQPSGRPMESQPAMSGGDPRSRPLESKSLESRPPRTGAVIDPAAERPPAPLPPTIDRAAADQPGDTVVSGKASGPTAESRPSDLTVESKPVDPAAPSKAGDPAVEGGLIGTGAHGGPAETAVGSGRTAGGTPTETAVGGKLTDTVVDGNPVGAAVEDKGSDKKAVKPEPAKGKRKGAKHKAPKPPKTPRVRVAQERDFHPVLGWRLLIIDLLGPVILAGIAALIALPYFHLADKTNSTGQIKFFSPPLWSLLIGPAESRIWGGPHAGVRASLGWPAEMSLLPGFVLYALALAGLWFSVWKFGRRILLMLALAASVVLTLGTNFFGGHWTYLPLFGHLPASLDQRIPGRMMLWVTLLLGILAAGAVSEFVRRAEHWSAQRIPPWPAWWLRLATLVPLILVIVEGWSTTAHPVVPDQPASMRTITSPMLVLPTGAVTDGTVMLWSTTRYQKIANGSGSFAATRQAQMRTAVASFPDATSIQYLRSINVTTVLLIRSAVAGTPWERAGDTPVDSLGITREDADDAVIFHIGAS